MWEIPSLFQLDIPSNKSLFQSDRHGSNNEGEFVSFDWRVIFLKLSPKRLNIQALQNVCHGYVLQYIADFL